MFSVEDLLTQGLPATREIEFVPAKRVDKPPLPEGLNIQILNNQPQVRSKHFAYEEPNWTVASDDNAHLGLSLQATHDQQAEHLRAADKAGTPVQSSRPVELSWKSVRRTVSCWVGFSPLWLWLQTSMVGWDR